MIYPIVYINITICSTIICWSWTVAAIRESIIFYVQNIEGQPGISFIDTTAFKLSIRIIY